MITAASFACLLLVFAAIGMLSMRARKAPSADDYLLAGREVAPWLAGLSAVATNNSGYMFVGQIGLTWTVGLGSIWLAIGWVLGDAIAWWLVLRPLREVSDRVDARSVPTLLAGGRRPVAVVAALLLLVFLGTYAAAQLLAGAKALAVVLDWDLAAGVWLGAALVLLYSYAGGLRASIWTDAAQSFVMIGAMAALVGWSLVEVGGPRALLERLHAIDPQLVDPFGAAGDWGFAPWVLGWLGAGFGVLGQPTIVVRILALRTPRDVGRAARWYFAWFAPFYLMTIALGLCARVLVPTLTDPELAMPTLARGLLPEVLIGVILAGVFAATMSTADSQLLACSAAITEDLVPRLRGWYAANKLATASVTLIALGIALRADDGVFALVLHAWSALAVTLGPLVWLRARGNPPRTTIALASMVGGLAVSFVWRGVGLSDEVYEVLPGSLASFAIALLGRRLE